MTQSGFRIIDIYYPVRRMTVKHLLVDWVSAKFSYSLSKKLERLLKRIGLDQRIVSLSVGDIVAVMGMKEITGATGNGNE
jgi:hypothetical protein